MKIEWSEEELKQINNMAVQAVIQTEFQNAVTHRAKEITAMIGDMPMTPEEIVRHYLKKSEIAVLKKGLLVPAK